MVVEECNERELEEPRVTAAGGSCSWARREEGKEGKEGEM
jgi:hypothetical protein